MGKIWVGFVGLSRFLHRMLGIIVLPWILLMGVSGFYLNHPDLIDAYLPNQGAPLTLLDQSANRRAANLTAGRAIALRVFGTSGFKLSNNQAYRERAVWRFTGSDGRQVMVDKSSGFFWIDSGGTVVTYDPDGTEVGRKVDYQVKVRQWHALGWISPRFGSWLADITAISMVLFGLTGIFLLLGGRRGRGQAAPEPMLAARLDATARDPVAEAPIMVPRRTPRPKRIKIDKD